MGDILPISGTQKGTTNVFVVINGKIILRDHKLDDPNNYNVLQIATTGAILGVKSLDFGNSCQPSVWSVVTSVVAHVVRMSKDTFDELWHDSLTRHKEIMRNVLNQCKMFSHLSVMTQCRIIYEVGVVQKFKPG